MNSYEVLAKAYEKRIQQDKERDTKEIREKIAALRCMGNIDPCTLFNTGAFNDICQKYAQKAMENCKISEKQIAAVMEEMRWLLDTRDSRNMQGCFMKDF